MTIAELKDKQSELRKKSENVIATAEAEKRMLTEVEQLELNTLSLERRKLDLQIEEEVRANNMLKERGGEEVKKEGRFSLRSAIMSKMGERADDTTMSMLEELRGERSYGNSEAMVLPLHETRAEITTTSGSAVIETETKGLLLPLQDELVLHKAGARFLTGLRGDFTFPSISDATVNWEGETAPAKDANIAISAGKVFKPKRLTAYTSISKTFLTQNSKSVESAIRYLLTRAIADKVEATALGSHEHAEGTPDGLFTGATSINKGVMTFANIVEMEIKLAEAKALNDRAKYLLHPSLLGTAKTTVKDKSGAGGFLYDRGYLNGYEALHTNKMPKVGAEYGILFGDFSEYLIGQWGHLELVVDPYSDAKKGLVNLIVTGSFDMGALRDTAIVKATMK